MGKVVDALDRGQRRYPPVAVPLAVIYKFADDQGNYLAAIIAYYAFVAIFPLLLLGTSILGFVLQGNPDLQIDLLDTALGQFPIIGDELGRPHGIQGSTAAAVVGALVALYGALGLGQALQNALNIAWSVPRNKRPNPILLRLKSLALLMTAGLAVLALSILSTLGSTTEVFGETISSYRWPIVTGTVAVVTTVLTVLFRFGTARSHSLRSALPGALTSALLWQAVQYLGALYVTKVLSETSSMNQAFGVVLGLIGLLYLAAVTGVIGIEVNVVLARRLWPRALLAPFRDQVELTEADRRAYAGYVLAQRHKTYEHVEVSFEDTTVRMPVVAAGGEGRGERRGERGGEPGGDGRPARRPSTEPDQRSGTNR